MLSGNKISRMLTWKSGFQFICLFVAGLIAFRGSGLELLVIEKILADPNPKSHWEKCASGRCHCKISGICNPHCCCSYRETHPEIVKQEIENNRFSVTHSCQGHHHQPLVWQALPQFIFPKLAVPVNPLSARLTWFCFFTDNFSSQVVDPPEKIPRLLSFSLSQEADWEVISST